MKILHVLFLVSATFFSPFALAKPTLPLLYEVNLNDRADDQFKVTLHVSGLTANNAILIIGTNDFDIGILIKNPI